MFFRLSKNFDIFQMRLKMSNYRIRLQICMLYVHFIIHEYFVFFVSRLLEYYSF